jgi:hypothetical protein
MLLNGTDDDWAVLQATGSQGYQTQAPQTSAASMLNDIPQLIIAMCHHA